MAISSQELFSRRAFLKLSVVAGLAPFAFEAPQSPEAPKPLVGLPAFETNNTPLIISYEKNWQRWVGSYIPAMTEVATVSGVPLEYMHPRYVSSDTLPAGIEKRSGHPLIVDVPHITGSIAHISALVGWHDRHYDLPPVNYRNSPGIKGAYSYSEKPLLYPRKLSNILQAFHFMEKYMVAHGPLKFGDEYSHQQAIGVPDQFDAYLYGGHYNWPAYGTCATASVTSKTSYLLYAQGLAREVERHVHGPSVRYYVNDFDPAYYARGWNPAISPVYNPVDYPDDPTDATWQYDRNPAKNWDFRAAITSPDPLWMETYAHVAYDSQPKGGLDTSPCDARLTFSVVMRRASGDINLERKQAASRAQAHLQLKETYESWHGNFPAR